MKRVIIELSTAAYTEAPPHEREAELARLREACIAAHDLGIEVAGGHGLDLSNVAEVAALPHMEELNIGHSIVAHAIFVGFERAVREMAEIMRRARSR